MNISMSNGNVGELHMAPASVNSILYTLYGNLLQLADQEADASLDCVVP